MCTSLWFSVVLIQSNGNHFYGGSQIFVYLRGFAKGEEKKTLLASARLWLAGDVLER